LILSMLGGKGMPLIHVNELQEMSPATKSNFPTVDGRGKRKRSDVMILYLIWMVQLWMT
jgi:hypothetical protein